jgi:hypothetical protein
MEQWRRIYMIYIYIITAKAYDEPTTRQHDATCNTQERDSRSDRTHRTTAQNTPHTLTLCHTLTTHQRHVATA